MIVVLLDRRAEKERPILVQQEQQAREITGAVVVQALLAQAAGLDVAVVVEDGEGVTVLQDARLLISYRGRGLDIEGARRGVAVFCPVLAARRHKLWSAHCPLLLAESPQCRGKPRRNRGSCGPR